MHARYGCRLLQMWPASDNIDLLRPSRPGSAPLPGPMLVMKKLMLVSSTAGAGVGAGVSLPQATRATMANNVAGNKKSLDLMYSSWLVFQPISKQNRTAVRSLLNTRLVSHEGNVSQTTLAKKADPRHPSDLLQRSDRSSLSTTDVRPSSRSLDMAAQQVFRNLCN